MSGLGEKAVRTTIPSAAVPRTTGTALRTQRSGVRRGSGLQAATARSQVARQPAQVGGSALDVVADDRGGERAGVADRDRHEPGEADGPGVEAPAAVGDRGGDEAHEQDVGERIEQDDDVEAVLEGVLDAGEEDGGDDGLGDERAGHAVQRGAERQPARAVREHEREAGDAEQERRGAEGDADDLGHASPSTSQPVRALPVMPATSARPSASQPRRDDGRSTPRERTSAGAEEEQDGQPGLEGGPPIAPVRNRPTSAIPGTAPSRRTRTGGVRRAAISHVVGVCPPALSASPAILAGWPRGHPRLAGRARRTSPCGRSSSSWRSRSPSGIGLVVWGTQGFPLPGSATIPTRRSRRAGRDRRARALDGRALRRRAGVRPAARAGRRYGPRPAGSTRRAGSPRAWRRCCRPGASRRSRAAAGLQNVVGRCPARSPRSCIGAHYDTLDIPGFVGANDGAAGVAVVVAAARELRRSTAARARRSCASSSSTARRSRARGGFFAGGVRGSKAYARPTRRSSAPRRPARHIGEKDLAIPREQGSDRGAVDEGARRGAAGRHRAPFPDAASGGVLDDHTPFQERGIPAIDLIDFTPRCATDSGTT